MRLLRQVCGLHMEDGQGWIASHRRRREAATRLHMAMSGGSLWDRTCRSVQAWHYHAARRPPSPVAIALEWSGVLRWRAMRGNSRSKMWAWFPDTSIADCCDPDWRSWASDPGIRGGRWPLSGCVGVEPCLANRAGNPAAARASHRTRRAPKAHLGGICPFAGWLLARWCRTKAGMSKLAQGAARLLAQQ